MSRSADLGRRAAALAIAGVLAVGFAACGSSDDDSSSTAAPAASSSTAAPAAGAATTAATASGKPITVGYLCSCSGALAATYGKAAEGITTWEKAVNASGGINGHPVKVIVKDDGGDPAKALNAVKELVEQDHIVALVGEVSTVDGTFGDYMQQKQVPVVGGQASDPPFETNPYFFATGPGLNVVTFGLFQSAQEAGGTKVGELFCAEAPVCGAFDKVSQAATKILGMDYTSLKTAATTPNYTAACSKLKGEGIDVMSPALDSTTATRVVGSCAKLGLKPQLVEAGGSVGQAILEDPNFEGTLVSQSQASYTDEQFPGTKEMIDAFEKYSPGVIDSPQFNYEVQASWLGGKLFEAASKAAGGFTPESTSADVLKGLYAIDGETLGGVAPPLKFTEGTPTLSQCYFVQQVKDKKLVSADTKPHCLTDEQSSQLKAAVGN
jgi:branched-chain amino acid transport system substrate-binding protein